MAVASPAPAAPAATTPGEIASPAYKWTLGGALAAFQSLVYFGIGHLHLNRSTELLRTRLDDAIPFWPWTAWCYLPFYAGVFLLAIAGIRRRALFNRAVLAVLVVLSIGAIGHVFVGAEYPRPILHPPYASLSAAFMAAVQRIDPPGNVFPSLHVAHTTMLALILIKDRPLLGRIALAMATALALSTLTTKQHFLADVVSGYALAFFGRWIALRKLPGPLG
ncbi:MAG TPA: phosphatase PAP2 family protein [Polyangia bacterium]|jgi:membrane-associated phospholipid phosphatase